MVAADLQQKQHHVAHDLQQRIALLPLICDKISAP